MIVYLLFGSGNKQAWAEEVQESKDTSSSKSRNDYELKDQTLKNNWDEPERAHTSKVN